jgi:DNA (cytosine-5)-methyltransferase 1
MLENVRGLLGPEFGDYREQIDAQLRWMGYAPQWKLLNASDFGVPQLRHRAILVALRSDAADYFEWPEPNPCTVSVGDVLIEEMASNGWEGASEWATKADGIAPTLVGGSRKHGGPDLGPTRARKAWAAMDVDGIALANEAPEPGFTGMPRLTVKMTAILQGFPKEWEIQGKKTPAYRQVGNAFPPPVAEAVGRQIRLALEASTAHVLEGAAD